MSRAPCFDDLLVQVDKQFPSEWSPGAQLAPDQVEQLERISAAASASVTTLTSGIAAVGEMLAWAGSTGEMSEEGLTSLGWLVHHLAQTSCRLHDEARSAEYKLHTVPKVAPQNASPGKRGARSEVQP